MPSAGLADGTPIDMDHPYVQRYDLLLHPAGWHLLPSVTGEGELCERKTLPGSGWVGRKSVMMWEFLSPIAPSHSRDPIHLPLNR